MRFTEDDVKKWMNSFEGQTMDFKSHGVLSHPDDLADLFVAFGNNKFVSEDFGGRIIIGINENKTIESFIPKQGHEEHIMHVARDKCVPSINPEFETAKVDGKLVYVITIPKMTTTPYQLKTKNGNTFRIRVGSTIREPTTEELKKLYSAQVNDVNSKPLREIIEKEGVDLETDSWFVKFVLEKGREYLLKKYGSLKVPLNKEIRTLRIISIVLLLPIFSIFFWSALTRHMDSMIMIIGISFSFLVILAVILLRVVKLINYRRCQKCDSNFGIEKIESKLIDEKELYRKSDSVRIREIQRNTYKCRFCNDTFTKNERYEYDRE